MQPEYANVSALRGTAGTTTAQETGRKGQFQSGLAYGWHGKVPSLPTTSTGLRAHLFAKRSLDIVLSLAALIMLAPLLCIVAIITKMTSRGPVFFRQDRTGYNGKTFPMLKFRSMYADKGDASGIRQTVKNDPRVTPFGRFLRRTSIDELPQLFNILLGHMSVIGPRPHAPGMFAGGLLYEELVPYYHARHSMRPGLSGWAQANGYRGPTDDGAKAKARIDHDICYIQNFSVWLDIKIILLTIKSEFVTGNGL